MAEILIFVVIIAAVVVKIGMNSHLSSKKETTQTTKRMPDTEMAKFNEPGPDAKKAKPNEPRPDLNKVKPNEPKKRQESFKKRSAVIKARLVSGDSVQEQTEIKETDILTAAKENTREVELENDKDALAAESLMERVYDLIAKGADDTLVFQRDFLAEGMEMLNQITIPDSWDAE